MAFKTNYATLPGLKANSTGLASSQFTWVKMASTAGQAVAAGTMNSTTVGTTIYGLLQNDPGANEACEIAISGIAKMIAATSTIAVGDRIGINSTSKGTDAGVTDNAAYVARALEAAAAANDIITVLLGPSAAARY